MKWIENLILLSQDHVRVDVSDTEDGEYPAEGEDIHPMKKSIDSQSSLDGELSDNLILEDNEERNVDRQSLVDTVSVADTVNNDEVVDFNPKATGTMIAKEGF